MKKKNCQMKHPLLNHLNMFFAQYPAFYYRQDAFSTQEFYRMCDFSIGIAVTLIMKKLIKTSKQPWYSNPTILIIPKLMTLSLGGASVLPWKFFRFLTTLIRLKK